MKLKSTLILDSSTHKISFDDKLFFVGSCFGENISKKLSERKFKCLSNPFGILYNPISIFNSLDYIVNQKTFSRSDLFCYQEIWSSFDFHSDMSGLNPEKVLDNISENIDYSNDFLKSTKVVFITFGSAWVYEKINESGVNTIVANCHKIPSKEFKKRCLSVDEIVKKAEQSLAKIKRASPDLKIVFTVSPVRHLKDGFVENNLSKSTLLLAIHRLVSTNLDCSYFPSYELVIDDLRDYRFFKEDLVHPNNMAISYVFEQFINYYLDDNSKLQLGKVEQILDMLNHRINFTKSTLNNKFKDSVIAKIEKLEEAGFDFSVEKDSFCSKFL